MLKIRLARKGPKGNPTYRIIVMEERSKREGKYLACLGYWHKAKNKKVVNQKMLTLWISKGAKQSSSLKQLISI